MIFIGMKKIFLILALFMIMGSYSQTVTTDNKLIINHGDITLYLTKDTCTYVSKHILSYSNFLKIKGGRDNKWYQDTYKGKYKKEAFAHSGYDLGHLTPSHITTYDTIVNHNTFSMFNEGPQLSYFNEHPWEQLEMSVEKIIGDTKKDVVIITGVIYDPNNKKYLKGSRIPIPEFYYKILFINGTTQAWIGNNTTSIITPTTLTALNQLFITNKMDLKIK